MILGNLQLDGYCVLPNAIELPIIEELKQRISNSLGDEQYGAGTKSSRGHVYAARNLIESMPLIRTMWVNDLLFDFLLEELGADFGLVRILFFDKPPERTWSLPWHKDQSVAVRDNSIQSKHFSRPTLKSGVPHFVASNSVLEQMLTLRIHLDNVSTDNGPLEVMPGSHLTTNSTKPGTDNVVKILVDAGDVLAMRPLLSHASGSSKENINRHRRILHLEFSANSKLPDGVEWHDFVRIRTDS